MQRSSVAVVTSVTLLGICFKAWPALFLFAKVLYAPQWAEALPSVLCAAPLLSLLCLAPIPTLVPGVRAAGYGLLQAVLVAPLIAAAIYFSQRVGQNGSLLLNTAFNYFWVLGMHLLGPALVLFCAKAAWQFATTFGQTRSDT